MANLESAEREYLRRLLDVRHEQLMHELHHAFTHEYKLGLKEEIALTERLKDKLKPQ